MRQRCAKIVNWWHEVVPAFKMGQDGQCTYNLTLWKVRVTTVAAETQQCILFFQRYLKYGTIFEYIYIYDKMYFSILYNFCLKRFSFPDSKSYKFRTSSCKATTILVRF